MDHIMNVYRRVPVTLDRGDGVWVWDLEGNQYLDALAGIAVTVLGHAHPAVTNTIQRQAEKIIHTSNIYHNPNQIKLAEVLCRLSGLDQVFFCNSGAEAVECALKLSKLYGHKKGIDDPHVIVMEGAFHGRSLATIAAGGSKKAQAGFEPLVGGFIRVPFDNVEAIEAAARNHTNIAAILVEPIQGESGINIPKADYLIKIRELCDKNQWMMIVDEVQTGMGRTGNLFAYQAYSTLPDVCTLAKGLANGVPIGACLARQSFGALFQPGNHGSTFGGNPLATAAGITTLEVIETQKLWNNAAKQGTALLEGLKDRLKNHPHVKAIRGKGLMLGIELDRPCREIMLVGLKKGLLFTVSNETVIRLLPPLILEDEHVQQIITRLTDTINEFTKPS
jgi:acetylornithine/N-succinyldiaminopimelate aminotransferase